MSLERRQVVYRGRVQGVGFRVTAKRLATGFELSGSVRNLTGGGVELIAQGNPARLLLLLDAIRTEFGSGIESEDVSCLTVLPGDTSGGFRILH